MKQTFIFACLLSVLTAFSAAGQGSREEMSDALKSQQIAYITAQLDLTPKESEKFWPIYNEYKNKERALRDQRRMRIDIDNMTDQEAAQWLKKSIENEEKELALKKEYTNKFTKILPIKKVIKLEMAESEFKRALIKKLGDRRMKAKPKSN